MRRQGACPIFPAIPKLQAPTLEALVYWNAEIPRGSNVVVSMFGADHTFKCLGTWAGNAARMPGSTLQNGACLAVRWE